MGGVRRLNCETSLGNPPLSRDNGRRLDPDDRQDSSTQGPSAGRLTRQAFGERFRQAFYDPRFDGERDAIDRLEEIAWRNYCDARKSPRTEKAGPGFADPDFDLSIEWKAARDRINEAARKHGDPAFPSRVLIVCGSPRNDGTCPEEVSKSWRLCTIVRDTLAEARIEADLLDLSLLSSGYRYHIHPCKGCVSTAQPLCHWPCSCYPNHELGPTASSCTVTSPASKARVVD
jgi:hypothetical protein